LAIISPSSWVTLDLPLEPVMPIINDGNRVAIGGNIGKPALECLSDKIDYYVLELSSYVPKSLSCLGISIPKYLALSSVGVSGSSALITGCWQYWYRLSLDLT
jgi:hypothetical protein